MKVKINLSTELNAVINISETLKEDYILANIIKFGNWEPNITKKVLSILIHAKKNQVDGVFVDVGACYGYYSIIASLIDTPVIAYEPNPESFEVLKDYIKSSKKKILLNEYALGSKNQTSYLNVKPNNIGASLIDLNPEGLKIAQKKLDEELIKEKILLLKLDVEGYEGEVIKGGLNLIKKNPPEFILVEVSPKFNNISDIINQIFTPLWSNGYSSYDIGLQDSGPLSKALNKFQKFESLELLNYFLTNTGQTNFLFIKHDKTVDNKWKKELIHKWTNEYLDLLVFERDYFKIKHRQQEQTLKIIKSESNSSLNEINNLRNKLNEQIQKTDSNSLKLKIEKEEHIELQKKINHYQSNTEDLNMKNIRLTNELQSEKDEIKVLAFTKTELNKTINEQAKKLNSIITYYKEKYDHMPKWLIKLGDLNKGKKTKE